MLQQTEWVETYSTLTQAEKILLQMLTTEFATNLPIACPEAQEWYQLAFYNSLPLIRRNTFDHGWWYKTLRFLRAGRYGIDDVDEFLTDLHSYVVSRIIGR